eukprot:GHVS01087676.1.p1 GENE.GHVS01087676.1~~GHVS01087676.1.p1  ORF type:complete len:482 (-),score=65.28 GHVS01087676.1:56-1501(-)
MCQAKLAIWSLVLALAIVATGILFVVEFRAVSHRRKLYTIMNTYMPVSCVPDDMNEGKLIHVDCPLQKLDRLHPSSAFSGNVDSVDSVFLEQRVEMFQWTKSMGLLGPYNAGEFSTDLVESPSFTFSDSYKNPAFFPNIPGQGRKYTTSIFAGGFSIPETNFKLAFKNIRQLPLVSDGSYSPPDTSPPLYVDSTNTQMHDNALYTGNPKYPKIGDIRVTFWAGAATHASVMGKQTGGLFDYRIDGFPNPDNMNTSVLLYVEGDYSPEQLLTHALRESDGDPFVVWCLRVAVFLLIWASVGGCCCCCCDINKSTLIVTTCSAALSACFLCVLLGSLWIICSIVAGAILFSVAGICFIASLAIWLVSKGNNPNCRPGTTTASMFGVSRNSWDGNGMSSVFSGFTGHRAADNRSTAVASPLRGGGSSSQLNVPLAPMASPSYKNSSGGDNGGRVGSMGSSGGVVRWSTSPAWRQDAAATIPLNR